MYLSQFNSKLNKTNKLYLYIKLAIDVLKKGLISKLFRPTNLNNNFLRIGLTQDKVSRQNLQYSQFTRLK